MSYVGRFAPSPTGPLHQGSLIAALASWLDAQSHAGKWLVRIEDLDPPRQPPGTDTVILESLEAHGLNWDGKVLYQSQRSQAYLDTIQTLLNRKLAFHCQCSRKQLENQQGLHQGVCHSNSDAPTAIRLEAPDEILGFDDLIQGHYEQHLRSEVGDFVIHRKDGLFAYQLAVVVDDEYQGVTNIVRGLDIIDSTPRQLYLQRLLDCRRPHYAHLPLLKNSSGQKLSKQNHAPAIDNQQAANNLFHAMESLGLNPSKELLGANITDMLTWATNAWKIESIPLTINQPWQP